jgi:hypothetical protein
MLFSVDDLKKITGNSLFPTTFPTHEQPTFFKKNIYQPVIKKQDVRKLKKGDIVGVSRGIYDHYGIYRGKSTDEVIHFTSLDSDTSPDNNEIQITSFNTFLRGSDSYFIVDLSRSNPADFGMHVAILSSDSKFKRSEIVQRALSKVLSGEKYDILSNNCEHFVFWCVTEVKYSSQVFEPFSRYLSSNRIHKKRKKG